MESTKAAFEQNAEHGKNVKEIHKIIEMQCSGKKKKEKQQTPAGKAMRKSTHTHTKKCGGKLLKTEKKEAKQLNFVQILEAKIVQITWLRVHVSYAHNGPAQLAYNFNWVNYLIHFMSIKHKPQIQQICFELGLNIKHLLTFQIILHAYRVVCLINNYH